MNRIIRNNKGFTLIEMIIALSIFVLVMVIATNIYLTINNSQRRVVAMQKIQDDVRYTLEAMSQEIRLGRINYQFYPDHQINLHPLAATGGNNNYVLALYGQTNNEIFFRRSSSVADANNGQGPNLQYCEVGTANTCDLLNDSLWQNVTPTGVEVLDLRFIITPSANPYVEVTPTACTDTGINGCPSAIGYSCPAASCPTCFCQYFTDGHNFQPKVRIVIKTLGLGKNQIEQANITMQTTVDSRIFVDKVKNLNYD